LHRCKHFSSPFLPLVPQTTFCAKPGSICENHITERRCRTCETRTLHTCADSSPPPASSRSPQSVASPPRRARLASANVGQS